MNAIKTAWELMIDGYETVVDLIAHFPRVTFWLFMVTLGFAIFA